MNKPTQKQLALTGIDAETMIEIHNETGASYDDISYTIARLMRNTHHTDARKALHVAIQAVRNIDSEQEKRVILSRLAGRSFHSIYAWLIKQAKTTSKPEVDNWHARGGLPPVGEVCEYNDADGWQKCKILALDSKGFLVVELFSDDVICHGNPDECYTFRPIQSERDKVIEAALKSDPYQTEHQNDSAIKAYTESLYERGMLKLPEDNQ